jgi:hypothetical protein
MQSKRSNFDVVCGVCALHKPTTFTRVRPVSEKYPTSFFKFLKDTLDKNTAEQQYRVWASVFGDRVVVYICQGCKDKSQAERLLLLQNQSTGFPEGCNSHTCRKVCDPLELETIIKFSRLYEPTPIRPTPPRTSIAAMPHGFLLPTPYHHMATNPVFANVLTPPMTQMHAGCEARSDYSNPLFPDWEPMRQPQFSSPNCTSLFSTVHSGFDVYLKPVIHYEPIIIPHIVSSESTASSVESRAHDSSQLADTQSALSMKDMVFHFVLKETAISSAEDHARFASHPNSRRSNQQRNDQPHALSIACIEHEHMVTMAEVHFIRSVPPFCHPTNCPEAVSLLVDWDFPGIINFAVSRLDRTLEIVLKMTQHDHKTWSRSKELPIATRKRRAFISFVMSSSLRSRTSSFGLLRLALGLAMAGMGINVQGFHVLQAVGLCPDYSSIHAVLKQIVKDQQIPKSISGPVLAGKRPLVLFFDNADSAVRVKHQRVGRETSILHSTVIGVFEGPTYEELKASPYYSARKQKSQDAMPQEWKESFPGDARSFTHFFDCGGSELYDVETLFNSPEFEDYQAREFMSVLYRQAGVGDNVKKSLEGYLGQLSAELQKKCEQANPRVYHRSVARVFANLPYVSTSHVGMAEVLLSLERMCRLTSFDECDPIFLIVDGASLTRLKEVADQLRAGQRIKRASQKESHSKPTESDTITGTSAATAVEDNGEDDGGESDDDGDIISSDLPHGSTEPSSSDQLSSDKVFGPDETARILAFVKRLRFIPPDLHMHFHHLMALSRYMSPVVMYAYKSVLERHSLDPWSPQRHYYLLHETFSALIQGLWDICLTDLVSQDLPLQRLLDSLKAGVPNSLQEWKTMSKRFLDQLALRTGATSRNSMQESRAPENAEPLEDVPECEVPVPVSEASIQSTTAESVPLNSAQANPTNHALPPGSDTAQPGASAKSTGSEQESVSSTKWILDMLLRHSVVYFARKRAVRFGDCQLLNMCDPYLGLLFCATQKRTYSHMMSFYTTQRAFASPEDEALLTLLRTWSISGNPRSNVAGDERYEMLIGDGQRYFDMRRGNNANGLTDADAAIVSATISQLARGLAEALDCSLYQNKHSFRGTISLDGDRKLVAATPFLKRLVCGSVEGLTDGERRGLDERAKDTSKALEAKRASTLLRYVSKEKISNCVDKYAKLFTMWKTVYFEQICVRGCWEGTKATSWLRLLRMTSSRPAKYASPEQLSDSVASPKEVARLFWPLVLETLYNWTYAWKKVWPCDHLDNPVRIAAVEFSYGLFIEAMVVWLRESNLPWPFTPRLRITFNSVRERVEDHFYKGRSSVPRTQKEKEDLVLTLLSEDAETMVKTFFAGKQNVTYSIAVPVDIGGQCHFRVVLRKFTQQIQDVLYPWLPDPKYAEFMQYGR